MLVRLWQGGYTYTHPGNINWYNISGKQFGKKILNKMSVSFPSNPTFRDV